MNAERLLRALFLAFIVALAACGGPEEDDDVDWLDVLVWLGVIVWELAEGDGRPEIAITNYSYISADRVRINGTTSESDATIEWSNKSGGTGSTHPRDEFCLAFCEYDWEIELPLVPGENDITVIASGDEASSEAHIVFIQPTQARP